MRWIFVLMVAAGCGSRSQLSSGWVESAAAEVCDEVTQARDSTDLVRGISGVVMARSADCEKDCCSYATSSLALWASEDEIDIDVASELIETEPMDRFEVDTEFERELPEGHHLVCARRTCAALHIESTTTFTLNVQRTFGPPLLFVFRPGDSDPRESLVFELTEE